jgi:hypothetical protein
MQNNYFLFLDETHNNRVPINITSVTGLLVPVIKFPKIRDSINSIVSAIDKGGNIINVNPILLKYSNLLPNYDDATKFNVLNKLVDLIVEEQLAIYRVGYYLKKEFVSAFSFNHFGKQATFCYSTLCFALQPILEKSIVIPVFDAGFDQSFQVAVDRLSDIQKTTTSTRVAGAERLLSIKNSHNLTDVFFADDNHVGLIQLADIVAGLRKESEIKRETEKDPETNYRKKMLSISDRLESAIEHDETILMINQDAL